MNPQQMKDLLRVAELTILHSAHLATDAQINELLHLLSEINTRDVLPGLKSGIRSMIAGASMIGRSLV